MGEQVGMRSRCRNSPRRWETERPTAPGTARLWQAGSSPVFLTAAVPRPSRRHRRQESPHSALLLVGVVTFLTAVSTGKE